MKTKRASTAKTVIINLLTTVCVLSFSHADASVFAVSGPIIDSLIALETDAEAKITLKSYFEILKNPSKLKSDEAILNFFALRSNAQPVLDNLVGAHYSYMQEKLESEYWYDEALEAELNASGFRTVWAEGFLGGLTTAPVLENQIAAAASEELAYYLKIKDLEASSEGSEYPLDDVDPEIGIVYEYEQLMNKFPQSQYLDLAWETFELALSILTDVHMVTDGDYTNCIAWGFEISYWPNGTSCGALSSYVSGHPESRFSPVFSAIEENKSVIEAQAEDVYVVEVPPLTEKTKWATDYLMKGIDVAHALSLKQEDGSYNTVLAYRFYTEKTKAEEALSKIRPTIPGAKIVVYKASVGRF